ncbi:hypothetical protein CB1_000639003 [Camelus ferus]|nr:hypothetical protein CB1_000639003 [Camelus ferus]
MVNYSASRSEFINSVILFLRNHDFNGLHISWIYPDLKDDTHFTVPIQVQFLKDLNWGGAMMRSIDIDDFTDKFCNQGPYTLIQVDLTLSLDIQEVSWSFLMTKPTCCRNGRWFGRCSTPGSQVPEVNRMYILSAGCRVPTSSLGTSMAPIVTEAPSGFCAGKSDCLYASSTSKRTSCSCVDGHTPQEACQMGLVFDPSCSSCNWA